MKAVLMTKTGRAIEALALADIPEPEITTPTQVKIKIMAAGINPIDTKVRRNGTFYEEPLPVVLGCDGAGVITEVGGQVNQFKVGDEVWFCHGGLGKAQGNYAEYNVIDQNWLGLKPSNLSFVEAAAMPLALITAWGALFDKGGLQSGQTVLIHAGAGGVGHLAVQLAKLKGAKVLTTVSNEQKAEFASSLGADYVLNYNLSSMKDQVMALTDGQGCDLVIDTVGATTFAKSIDLTRYFGRIITLLDPGEQNFFDARVRNLMVGFELMLTPMIKELRAARLHQIEILKQCACMIEKQQLFVKVTNIESLENMVWVHETIETGHMMGKISIDLQ